jgi:YfiH family protein
MQILTSPLLQRAGFRHGFAERGVAHEDVARTLGVGSVAQTKQIHGSRTVEAADIGPDCEADAIVARAAGQPLAVGIRVADCVPVLAAGLERGDVVAIHAGWRGVVAGVVQEAMKRLGGTSVLVAIGPCIGGCCFEVGDEVADTIARAVPSAAIVARREGGKSWVDLRAAVRAQLASLVDMKLVVEDVLGCTKHEPQRFHSFRRDGAASGRMLAAIRTKSVSSS